MTLGHPRLHLRLTDSTNQRARELAARGAPHGTLVTATEQTAGRGRQGRTWSAPAGRALLMSIVLRQFDPLLPLRAGIAVADVVGPRARIKWPNDVWVDGRKIAGVLVEGRPQEGWAVLGIGLNVAIDLAALPPELQQTAATMGRQPADLEATLSSVLEALQHALSLEPPAALDRLRALDALNDQPVRWAAGEGTGAGIDDHGRLRVRLQSGETIALDAGEVHLIRSGPPPPDPRGP